MQGHSLGDLTSGGLQSCLTVNLLIALNQGRCGVFKTPKDEGLHLPGPGAASHSWGCSFL